MIVGRTSSLTVGVAWWIAWCVVADAPADDRTADVDLALAIRVAEPEASLPYVLLHNGNIVRGHVTQRGDRILVRRDTTATLSLSLDQVACWADSLTDVYQYRVDHRRPGDWAGQIDDVRWCLRHGLLDQAEAELDRLDQIRPNHPRWRGLRQQLESRKKVSASASSTANVIRRVSHQAPMRSTGRSPRQADWPADTVTQFTRQIQPLLINRCGRCHDARGDRAWTLTVPPGQARPSSTVTFKNIAAIVRWTEAGPAEVSVDDGEPPLLRFAFVRHGGSESPPISEREVSIRGALRKWIEGLSPEPNRSQTSRTEQDEPTTKPEPNPSEITSETSPTGGPPGREDRPRADRESPDGIDTPARLPTVADPFDPRRFNRRFHRQSRR